MSVAVGVTGHRNLSPKCSEIINGELKKINENYKVETVYSPLAEGADMVVAQFFINFNKKIKIIVPLPFDIKMYKKSFKDKDSENKFDDLLKSSYKNYALTNTYSLDEIQRNSAIKNELYKAVGEHVVDNSDIIIAVWNGKPSNGTGGTAEIVEYAKKKNKMILYINSETGKVKQLTYKGKKHGNY